MCYEMDHAGSGGLPRRGADSAYKCTVFVSAAGEEIAVTKTEMEALKDVKQEENLDDFHFPQSLNHINERQYHDPTMIESVPLAKFQRALNPIVERLSATLQTTPNVETDNVHHSNDLEPLTVAASDTISAAELEEPPNARASYKAQVVAEMVEFAFATCEGSNSNPGTKMMVSNLLQFLIKQYEADKALAVVEIDRLRDEKMKLEEERNLAMENFRKSESELEELKKKVATSFPDLEHENEELKTVILTMGVDMDVLKEKYNTVQSEVLSTRVEIEKLKKEKRELDRAVHSSSEQLSLLNRSSLDQVTQLKATRQAMDKKIDLLNDEVTVLRARVGKETHHIPETTPNTPVVTSALKRVPPELSPCDPVTQETEEPKRKKTRRKRGLDCAENLSLSKALALGLAPQKFGSELNSLMDAIRTLSRALDYKLREVFNMVPVAIPQKMSSKETQWIHCISRIVPPGYRFETITILKQKLAYKMVWDHWISAVMFQEFEDKSFGLKEEAIATPENLDANTKLPCTFDGNGSQFLAFVKRKHNLLFPPWMYQLPLLKILDADVYSKFKVIAEKIWMLHQIGRCCELPPSIFRPVPLSTRYDVQYHESRTAVPPETEKEPLMIMLVFMPGFVVGDTVIKSQVALRKKSVTMA